MLDIGWVIVGCVFGACAAVGKCLEIYHFYSMLRMLRSRSREGEPSHSLQYQEPSHSLQYQEPSHSLQYQEPSHVVVPLQYQEPLHPKPTLSTESFELI